MNLRTAIAVLADDIDESDATPDEYLYHVTNYKNLDSILSSGLKPFVGGGIGTPATRGSVPGVFLTEVGGVKYWYDRAEAFAEHRSDNSYEDGLTPVVLRIHEFRLSQEDSDWTKDEKGSSDSYTDAWVYAKAIPGSVIDVWNGSQWTNDVDPEIAYDFEDDGVYFKSHNPLREVPQ